MDHITQLHCRNAALQTELRLVKEQLAQARASINYILASISGEHTADSHQDITTLQSHLKQVQADNTQLRAALDLRPSHSHAMSSVARGTALQKITAAALSAFPPAHESDDRLHSRASFSPPATDSPHISHDDSDDVDLLCFDEAGSLSLTRSPAQQHVFVSHAASTLQSAHSDAIPLHQWKVETVAAPVGLGISGFGAEPQSTINGSPSLVVLDPIDDDGARGSGNTTATMSFNTFTPASSFVQQETPPTPMSSTPIGPRHTRFAHYERTMLLGAACFIEQLDGRSYAERWQQYARDKPRHSAEEWQEYYEGVIRPAYYTKQSKKELALDSNKNEDDIIDEATGVHAILGGVEVEAEARNIHVPTEKAVLKFPAVVDGSSGLDLDSAAEADEDAIQKLTEQSPGLIVPSEAPDTVEEVTIAPVSATDLSLQDAVSPGGFDKLPTLDEYLAQGSNTQPTSTKAVTTLRDGPQLNRSGPTPSTLQRAVPSAPPLSIPASCQDTTCPPTTDRRRSDQRGGRCDNYQAASAKPPCCNWPQDISALRHSEYPHDPRMLRTITISNIPPTISLAEVLEQVRGGKIVSASHLETSKMRTKPAMETDTVLISFLFADRAKAFVDACGKDWISFHSQAWDAPFKATVALISAPIRPVDDYVLRGIKQNDLTRIIFLADNGRLTPESVIEVITANNAQRGRICKHPLRSNRDADGILVFEYASVDEAVNAKMVIDRLHWEFGGMSRGFLPDPCARPLASLKQCAERPSQATTEPGAAAEDKSSDEDFDPRDLQDGSRAETDLAETEATIADPVTPELDSEIHQALGMTLTPVSPRLVTNNYSMGGDLALARSFLSSVKKNYAKTIGGRPRVLQRDADERRDVEEANKEDEAIGVEG